MHIAVIQNFPLRSHKALSTYLFNISQSLSKLEDIEITVISCGENSYQEGHDFSNISVKGDPYSLLGNIRYTLKTSRALRKLNKRKPIDVIHALYPLSSLAAIKLSRIRKKTKVIYDIRSPWLYVGLSIGSIPKFISSIYIKLASKIEKFLMRKTNGLIFITDELREFYSKNIPKNKKCLIIPSGINIELFKKEKLEINIKERLNLNKNSIVLGYIGSWEVSRNLEELIKLFSESLKIYSNLILVFIGKGTGFDKMTKKAEELNLNNSVFFVPPVNHEEIPSWIQSFDICISHIADILIFRQSFPLKLLEYAAMNKPILASKINPHQFFMEEYKNGGVYSDTKSFIESLDRVLQKKTKRSSTFNLEKYSWKNLSEKIQDFILQEIY